MSEQRAATLYGAIVARMRAKGATSVDDAEIERTLGQCVSSVALIEAAKALRSAGQLVASDVACACTNQIQCAMCEGTDMFSRLIHQPWSQYGPQPRRAQMTKPLTPVMQAAVDHARMYGGCLVRWPGGFWYGGTQDLSGDRKHFGTPTVEALVSRGAAEYTEWQEGRNGRFPVRASVSAATPE